jgi:hypothetical protein
MTDHDAEMDAIVARGQMCVRWGRCFSAEALVEADSTAGHQGGHTVMSGSIPVVVWLAALSVVGGRVLVG